MKKRKSIIYPPRNRKDLYYRISNAKGICAEMLVFKTLNNTIKKSIVGARFATENENMQGIDLFVKVFVRKYKYNPITVPIQVKSSASGIKKHERYNKGKSYIPAILVKRSMKPRNIQKRVMKAVHNYRKIVINSQKHLLT